MSTGTHIHLHWSKWKNIVCNAEFNSVNTFSTTHPFWNVGMYLQSAPYPAKGSCKPL